MTTRLLEAPRRRMAPEQRDLQDALKAVWNQMSSMDVEAERRVLARIAEMRRDVLDRLAALPSVTGPDGEATWQASSLRAYAAELDEIGQRFAARYGADLAADMRNGAAVVDQGYREALAQLAIDLGVPRASIILSPIGLSMEQVEAAILYNASAIKGVSARMATAVNAEVQRVVFGGGSRWDATTAIRDMLAAEPKWAGRKLPPKTLGRLTQQAITIERTALISVFGIAADHAFREATEELPGLLVEWVTVKDKRVDPICVALDGKRKVPRLAFPGGYVAPPAHPRCRCHLSAWLPAWGET